jgi:hypothetical protein
MDSEIETILVATDIAEIRNMLDRLSVLQYFFLRRIKSPLSRGGAEISCRL